jgi:Protein of unknown function (DUF4238)
MPKPTEKKLPKHHYIPVFYLKQWKGGDGRLCEYSKPYKKVVPRRTSPDGTGYVRGLYRLPNVSDDKAEVVETIYMKSVDDGAARALRILLDDSGGPSQMDDRMKTYWARFLHCLILRNPEYISAMSALLARNVGDYVDAVKDSYEKERRPTDPPTFEEYKAQFIANPLNTFAPRIINRIVDNQNIIRHMCGMRWDVVRFSYSQHLLLTSDRPIIMTNGVGGPRAHMALPLSPTQLFIACNDTEGYRQMRNLPPRELIRNSNTKVVEQARKYAYGLSDADLSFVSRRLGKQVPATPLETGILRLAAS